MSDEVAHDVARLEYAVATGDWRHFLELEIVHAEEAGDDGKGGAMMLLSTPVRELVLRLPSAEISSWVNAVNSVLPQVCHRRKMMDDAEVEGARMKAETNTHLNMQIQADMANLIAKDGTQGICI